MGQLATTLEHWEDAERHFSDALRLHQSWKWWLYVPWTQYGWALMLTRRNLSGDRYQALDLLDSALERASNIGMTKLTRLATALREQLLEERGPEMAR